MNEKTKKVFSTVGIIVLIIIVSGLLAYRKYYRKEVWREKQYEQSKTIMKNKKLQQQKDNEMLRIEEQQKQDSIQQAQREQMEAKKKETEEILKSIENEK